MPSARRTRGRVDRARRYKLAIPAAAFSVALAVAGQAAAFGSVARSTAPMGPEGIPLEVGTALAPASTSAGGNTVDGIACDASEQVVYHVHTHLSVYLNGKLRPIAAGIGLVTPVYEQTANGRFYGATHCYYWLHVHAYDGIIHIESPSEKSYTLGQFFDIWRQPLSATQVGPLRGKVTAYVNGKIHAGDPRTISLGSHVVIQLDIGTPTVAFQKVDWSNSQL